MENVSRALIIAFSMLMFVVGFSYSMYMINGVTTTSKALMETITTTNYYDNIKVSKENTRKRIVGVESIVPTLYRYNKESYAVWIFGEGHKLIQVFDTKIEGEVHDWAAYTGTDVKKISVRDSIYNKKNANNPAYMFGAPWIGSATEDARVRIDYFLNGEKGYINSTLVDYSTTIGPDGFLGQYGGKTFAESFVEYAYSGDTISTENRFRNYNWKSTRKI